MPTIVFATHCANCFRLGPDPFSPNVRAGGPFHPPADSQ
ncbi:hypothetical protein C4K26_4031 [Pseudomonas chlororaphis]|nr:hypothetical protein C4K26_4031 [Pseudomonas chlororaphis]